MSKKRFAITYAVFFVIGAVIDWLVIDNLSFIIQYLPISWQGIGTIGVIVLVLITLIIAFVLTFIFNVFMDLME